MRALDYANCPKTFAHSLIPSRKATSYENMLLCAFCANDLELTKIESYF